MIVQQVSVYNPILGLIIQRTSEGRERAKKQGKHLGRPITT